VIRFLIDQYKISCRVGFTPAKAIKRAVSAYYRGF
jgi:hypothetical protein